MPAEATVDLKELLRLLERAGLSVEGLKRLAATCSSGCTYGCSVECSPKCVTCYNGGSTGSITTGGFGRGEFLEQIIDQLRKFTPRAAEER
jgi:hypothetical protein